MQVMLRKISSQMILRKRYYITAIFSENNHGRFQTAHHLINLLSNKSHSRTLIAPTGKSRAFVLGFNQPNNLDDDDDSCSLVNNGFMELKGK